jgi:hypothetical protein
VDAAAPARDGMAGRVSREPLPGTQTNGAVSDFAKARRTGTKPGEAFGEDGSRTVKSCGPDASTPASSLAEVRSARPGADKTLIRGTTETNKPDLRGEYEISR